MDDDNEIFDHGNEEAAPVDYEQVIAEYSEAISLDSGDAEAYVCRGTAYRRIGDYERAAADYTAAIALDPDYADAYFGRGVARSRQERYVLAIPDFSQVLRLNLDDSQAHWWRAAAFGYIMGTSGRWKWIRCDSAGSATIHCRCK